MECACCQICNNHYGYESVNSGPPYPDMYVCGVCERTHHWKCMRELGCYNDEQRLLPLRSMLLKFGPVPPVLDSATKTKLTEHTSLKKNCL
eukprot:140795-Pelagomonas_calceolata.AAC.1